jgi:hypothetical protein
LRLGRGRVRMFKNESLIEHLASSRSLSLATSLTAPILRIL